MGPSTFDLLDRIEKLEEENELMKAGFARLNKEVDLAHKTQHIILQSLDVLRANYNDLKEKVESPGRPGTRTDETVGLEKPVGQRPEEPGLEDNDFKVYFDMYEVAVYFKNKMLARFSIDEMIDCHIEYTQGGYKLFIDAPTARHNSRLEIPKPSSVSLQRLEAVCQEIKHYHDLVLNFCDQRSSIDELRKKNWDKAPTLLAKGLQVAEGSRVHVVASQGATASVKDCNIQEGASLICLAGASSEVALQATKDFVNDKARNKKMIFQGDLNINGDFNL